MRKKEHGNKYHNIITVSADVTNFTDSVSDTGVYLYCVISKNDAGYSSNSNVVKAAVL